MASKLNQHSAFPTLLAKILADEDLPSLLMDVGLQLNDEDWDSGIDGLPGIPEDVVGFADLDGENAAEPNAEPDAEPDPALVRIGGYLGFWPHKGEELAVAPIVLVADNGDYASVVAPSLAAYLSILLVDSSECGATAPLLIDAVNAARGLPVGFETGRLSFLSPEVEALVRDARSPNAALLCAFEWRRAQDYYSADLARDLQKRCKKYGIAPDPDPYKTISDARRAHPPFRLRLGA